MKSSMRASFKLGQEITGQVLEVLDTREVILRVFVTGSPELIRVANESNQSGLYLPPSLVAQQRETFKEAEAYPVFDLPMSQANGRLFCRDALTQYQFY